MLHLLFCCLHVLAFLFWSFGLFITIPVHLIYTIREEAKAKAKAEAKAEAIRWAEWEKAKTEGLIVARPSVNMNLVFFCLHVLAFFGGSVGLLFTIPLHLFYLSYKNAEAKAKVEAEDKAKFEAEAIWWAEWKKANPLEAAKIEAEIEAKAARDDAAKARDDAEAAKAKAKAAKAETARAKAETETARAKAKAEAKAARSEADRAKRSSRRRKSSNSVFEEERWRAKIFDEKKKRK